MQVRFLRVLDTFLRLIDLNLVSVVEKREVVYKIGIKVDETGLGAANGHLCRSIICGVPAILFVFNFHDLLADR